MADSSAVGKLDITGHVPKRMGTRLGRLKNDRTENRCAIEKPFLEEDAAIDRLKT